LELRTGFPVSRLTAGVAFLVAVGLLVAQLSGWPNLEGEVDAVTLGLLLLALVLLFATLAPTQTLSFFERITSLKLPGVEVGLTAVSRAEQVQGRLSQSLEDISTEGLPKAVDDVKVQKRPSEGNTRQQFEVVQKTIKARLRFVHTVVFGKRKETERNYQLTLERLRTKGLLRGDEVALVQDLLGRAESEVEQLPIELRNEFLDAAWQFAVRFATLTHERLVRKKLVDQGWILLDFEQNRGHRPDFLAYRDDLWRLVAARVEPGKLKETRRRLSEAAPPFDAHSVIVIPDRRNPPEDNGGYGEVEVLRLTPFLDGADPN
jgi:hypothetical protein